MHHHYHQDHHYHYHPAMTTNMITTTIAAAITTITTFTPLWSPTRLALETFCFYTCGPWTFTHTVWGLLPDKYFFGTATLGHLTCCFSPSKSLQVPHGVPGGECVGHGGIALKLWVGLNRNEHLWSVRKDGSNSGIVHRRPARRPLCRALI